MKAFICVVFLAAVVLAEPPYRQKFYRFQRQELEQDPNAVNDAPYAPAGFRPTKEFNLPSRQEVAPPSTSYGVPDDSYSAPAMSYIVPRVLYGAPQTEYGAPQTEYGAPQIEYGTPVNREETEEQTDDTEDKVNNGAFKQVKGSNKEQKPVAEAKKNENLEEEPKKDAEVVSNQGVYYVLLPDAQLQRVQFRTENDLSNMAYTARLQYKNEDRAPVYVYTNVPQYQTAAYVQLF